LKRISFVVDIIHLKHIPIVWSLMRFQRTKSEPKEKVKESSDFLSLIYNSKKYKKSTQRL